MCLRSRDEVRNKQRSSTKIEPVLKITFHSSLGVFGRAKSISNISCFIFLHNIPSLRRTNSQTGNGRDQRKLIFEGTQTNVSALSAAEVITAGRGRRYPEEKTCKWSSRCRIQILFGLCIKELQQNPTFKPNRTRIWSHYSWKTNVHCKLTSSS